MQKLINFIIDSERNPYNLNSRYDRIARNTRTFLAIVFRAY